jgi:hypothetical protein
MEIQEKMDSSVPVPYYASLKFVSKCKKIGLDLDLDSLESLDSILIHKHISEVTYFYWVV